jgi:hypothetical protein
LDRWNGSWKVKKPKRAKPNTIGQNLTFPQVVVKTFYTPKYRRIVDVDKA